jgi:hypothetical protein
MPDLRDRFRDLDTLDVPDLLGEAERRGPRTPMSFGPSPGKRAAIVLVAILIAAVPYALFAARDRSASPTPAGPDVPADCLWTSERLALPTAGGRGRGSAFAVAGTSLDDLWVMASERPWLDQYLLHYDGQGWSEVPIPADLTASLSIEMAAPAPGDLWLMAPSGIGRFDGTEWSRMDFTGLDGVEEGGIRLSGLEVVGADDAWVTGSTSEPSSPNRSPVILHWDGSAWNWSYRGSEHPDAPARLAGVSSWASDDVWAIGETGGEDAETVALHWDGAEWVTRRVPGPMAGGSGVVAAMVASGPDEALVTVRLGVLRWDGGGWVDTDFVTSSPMDVPLSMEEADPVVWATVWTSRVGRWNGTTWEQKLSSTFAYRGMAVVGDAAVFAGEGWRGTLGPGLEVVTC